MYMQSYVAEQCQAGFSSSGKGMQTANVQFLRGVEGG